VLEAFISGFWQVMAWPAFGYMLLGIAIGFWVGLLPGIGGLATLALMLPFSYNIKDPISAFAFLLGMLAVTSTTGDLTSILFGIPGEGSSAALILDGYPMSKSGEAGRALGAAISASVVGAIIGALHWLFQFRSCGPSYCYSARRNYLSLPLWASRSSGRSPERL
jgi:putative tricarboxylic transport membrane protein